jgi:hypothetical protein
VKVEFHRAVVDARRKRHVARPVLRSVDVISTGRHDEVYYLKMATAKMVNVDTGQQLGTVERNEISNASRVVLEGVEYDVVREFRYGPELTIGVRPLLAG